MTKDQITAWAGEAGLMGNPLAYADWYPKALEHFAALVAAAERKAILQIGRDQWFKTQADFEEAIRARGQE